MVEPDQNSHDATSIKPVSSLRSKFEGMIQAKAGATARTAPTIPMRPGRRDGLSTNDPTDEPVKGVPSTYAGVDSLDAPRSYGHPSPRIATGFGHHFGSRSSLAPATPTTRTRPVSMISLSPSSRSPPRVTVNSPHSPPRFSMRPVNATEHATFYSRPQSPTLSAARSIKISSRPETPTLDSSPVPHMPLRSTSIHYTDPEKFSVPNSPTRSTAGSIPPPINRAGKPKPFAQASIPQQRQVSDSLAAPQNDFAFDDEKVSPFSTPPSESESPTQDLAAPVPEYSKPRQSQAAPSVRDNYFTRAPVRRNDDDQPPPMPPRTSQSIESTAAPARGRILAPPALPPRRDARVPPPLPQPRLRSPTPPFPPPEPPIRRSNDYATHIHRQSDFNRPSLDNDIITKPRQYESRSLNPAARRPSEPKDVPRYPPPPSRPRPAVENTGMHPPPPEPRIPQVPDKRLSGDSDEEEETQAQESVAPLLTDFPDASQANRRPPRFGGRPYDIHSKYETKLFAICGDFVCTTGYITKAWNVVTGEQMLNITHGEHIKATAIAFKQTTSVEYLGRRIWIGTNTGELHEIDIVSKEFISQRADAHSRTPVTHIHRHVSDMWTFDEEGKLLVWPSGEEGPSLNGIPQLYRVPPKANFLMVLGSKIWVAIGKGLWVYEHDPSQRIAKNLTPTPLVQPGVGDVTSGTTVAGQPDKVYFGHSDGKVTIYSRKNHAFLGQVQIRDYKISSLAGVGSYLWAGFNTGMIYVYDMTTQPWKVLKDWRAHEGTIAGIQVDKTSIWKLDRLQVASLGTDGALKLWDGMMTDDWLEADLQHNDDYFCNFNEITTSVLTWNAGASKPSHLWADERDKNFFRDYLTSSEPSDIYIFGFQELVDLEDAGSARRDVTSQVMKKMFRRDKKKESGHTEDHERMRHQYRDWRDHLARMLDENMPQNVTYQLLHTSSLVGLFTCVFVKDSIRDRINYLDGAQIRLGMGGRLGNKGALVVRFLVDDSSLCFLNCHLAAGQSHTRQRNENVASIMEASPLPNQVDSQVRAASFVGGGDGSMVLDHEICILNGDLNYRIDSTPRDGVISELKRGQMTKLLERDQLLVSRRKNPGFRLRAFEERPITFNPTYKYDVGTDTYDTSEKQRSPAWCDRILYRGLGSIYMDEYRRWEVRTSDHRPVSGLFRIRVKTVKPVERERMRQDGEMRFAAVKEAIARAIK